MEEEADFWRSQKIEGDVYKRIFVGGFSQGCAISLLWGLSNKIQVGGVIGFSGYLFQSFEIRNAGKIPILLYHGEYDPTIPYKHAMASYGKISKSEGVEVRKRDIGHQVEVEQMTETTEWIMKRLKADSII